MINSYLTGNNQYGGSSSANKGMTLNPGGYIQRESDRRSQLAQQAMQRTAQPGTAQQPGAPLTTRPSGDYNFSNRTPTGRILPAPIADLGSPIAPNIEAPTGQPPDSTYNQQAFEASTGFQDQARQMLQDRQLAELAYTKQARGLQEGFDDLPGQVRGMAAGRGMLRSSFFGKTMDDQTRALTDELNSSLENRSFADQTYTSGLADLTGNYSKMMALAAQQLASRNAEQAGKLGIGTPDDKDKIIDESNIGDMINDIINPKVDTSPVVTPGGTTPSITPAAPAAPKPGASGIPQGNYQQGAKGDTVKRIQTIVGSNPDGVWGPKTTAAVKAWQQSHGLVADGIVGPKTIAAMGG